MEWLNNTSCFFWQVCVKQFSTSLQRNHSMLERSIHSETHPSIQTQTYHYNDVIMSTMVPQITSISIVCSTVCSDADQRKYQSSTSLAFVRGTHQWPVNSPHKGQVTWKMFPFDDIIMNCVSTMLFKCLDYKHVFGMEFLLFCNNPAIHSSTLWINIHFRSHHQIEFHCGSLSSMVYQLQGKAAIQNAHVGLTISSSADTGFVRTQIKYRLQVTGI